MDDQEEARLRLSRSDFIDNYVKEHSQELAELRAKASAKDFDGEWFLIGDENYVEKRAQYATTSFEEGTVSPRIILYPAVGSADEDVRKAIALCDELGMAIAVRTGGHQYCGYSSTVPENLQIDLSLSYPLYEYDKQSNVLRCGVSHALGDWAGSNADNGIYLPMGVCSHVHLGGHVHTGGWGMVARSHGLLADHVLAFEIFLANGNKERIVRPEEGTTTQHNDDVFFAVLGGGKGGDFGIVTHWEFRPIRDAEHPNSACYALTWLWSKDKMEGAVSKLAELSKLCADGTIPSDYEFMLNITGLGMMDVLPDRVKNGLKMLGTFGKELAEEITVPPLIQVWMCFTNKGGESQQFDDRWFESFTEDDVCGEPLLSERDKNFPVSKGLTDHFIMKQEREMEYPFVKRFRATMDVPAEYPKVYTERMSEIMGFFGTWDDQHLVSQQQIYAGGALAENGKLGLTSYSWREQALALSHDAFYELRWFDRDARDEAEKWQSGNDKAFIEEQAFADADMRMFAYTFGTEPLKEVWSCFYDSKEKYERLVGIKAALDPNGLFSASHYSLRPPSL